MTELLLPPQLSRRIADLYAEMEAGYDRVAAGLGFSCRDCPDNCCDSYFQHHTYTEWAYLWEGLRELPAGRLEAVRHRARRWLRESEARLAAGERPAVMCPLNEEGLCSMYPYRLMICRLHGVPAGFTRPDGRRLYFPGCFRCQEQLEGQTSPPALDRTSFYRRLVELETMLLTGTGQRLPRIKLTLAEMVEHGPPKPLPSPRG